MYTVFTCIFQNTCCLITEVFMLQDLVFTHSVSITMDISETTIALETQHAK